MLVDFRPTDKLRGSKPVDVTAALGPVVDALAEGLIDLSRVRVVCDWVQYRSSFRDVVDLRPILAAMPGLLCAWRSGTCRWRVWISTRSRPR